MAISKLSDEQLMKRFITYCEYVNTPFSHRAINAARRDPKQLKNLLPVPGEYEDAESFAKDWQCYSFLKKFKGLPGSSDSEREAAALTSWSAGEISCYHTNERIRPVFRGEVSLLNHSVYQSNEKPPVTLAAVISAAQLKIESVLGPFNWKVATHSCRWSSGATVDHPRGTQMSKKMTERITVTSRALPHLRKVMARDPSWMAAVTGRETYNYCSPLDHNFAIVEHNRFITVPKTAFTDRCIAAEPTGNAFLQQGVGRYIRKRMKRVGIDLDDQSFNQYMASIAHRLGYSTLDLESASDTVSLSLIELLLPSRWFQYLSDLRTPFTKVNGKRRKLEKFSSMGNAFTFELESLIFWAIAQSVNELVGEEGGTVAVFGDDIVCKRAVFDPLRVVLNWCGFKVNTRKSYRDGPFFESCGANYFMGVDVTGFHQDKSLISEVEVIKFHNRLVRWSIRIFGTPFSPVYKLIGRDLADGALHRVPMSEVSDGGFLSPVRALGKFCPNHGYLCRVLQFVPNREIQYKQRAFYAYKLRKPRFMNGSPDGQPYVTADEGSWVSTERWIHRIG
jgi:hypothetical protein